MSPTTRFGKASNFWPSARAFLPKPPAGVTVGVARKLIASGAIASGDSAVLCITGNGLKTLDAVAGHTGLIREIKPSLREFEALLAHGEKAGAQQH